MTDDQARQSLYLNTRIRDPLELLVDETFGLVVEATKYYPDLDTPGLSDSRWSAMDH